jgi:mannose-6-phosphate isomerase-like protein (cupin superfamily)
MIIEQLQQALEHLGELTDEEQAGIAEQIIAYSGGANPRGARARRLAGAWADPPDDMMEDTLLRWRHETPPTPLVEDVSHVTSGDADAIRLAGKLAQFQEYWAPRTVAIFNGHDIMVVKVSGEFVWHTHADTDEFFLVLRGTLTIRLRDREVRLEQGDLFVVPRGVEHQPVATGEAHLLLIEPTGTPNTGDASTAAPRREL